MDTTQAAGANTVLTKCDSVPTRNATRLLQDGGKQHRLKIKNPHLPKSHCTTPRPHTKIGKATEARKLLRLQQPSLYSLHGLRTTAEKRSDGPGAATSKPTAERTSSMHAWPTPTKEKNVESGPSWPVQTQSRRVTGQLPLRWATRLRMQHPSHAAPRPAPKCNPMSDPSTGHLHGRPIKDPSRSTRPVGSHLSRCPTHTQGTRKPSERAGTPQQNGIPGRARPKSSVGWNSRRQRIVILFLYQEEHSKLHGLEFAVRTGRRCHASDYHRQRRSDETLREPQLSQTDETHQPTLSLHSTTAGAGGTLTIARKAWKYSKADMQTKALPATPLNRAADAVIHGARAPQKER